MLETPDRALVIIPHPDDGEGGCGGTVAKWVKHGTEVNFVLCTDGRRGSSDPEMTPERLAFIRDGEQLEAAAVLGVKEVVMLRHPDGELEDTREFRKELVRAIRRFRPDVVLCNDPSRRLNHSHRDHRMTGQVALDAVFPYARDRLHFYELLQYEGLEPHKTGTALLWTSEDADTAVDIKETIDLKIRALLCHKSQFITRTDQQVEAFVRERARKNGESFGMEYAEAFRKLEFRR